jgi:hypothetical protein
MKPQELNRLCREIVQLGDDPGGWPCPGDQSRGIRRRPEAGRAPETGLAGFPSDYLLLLLNFLLEHFVEDSRVNLIKSANAALDGDSDLDLTEWSAPVRLHSREAKRLITIRARTGDKGGALLERSLMAMDAAIAALQVMSTPDIERRYGLPTITASLPVEATHKIMIRQARHGGADGRMPAAAEEPGERARDRRVRRLGRVPPVPAR